MTVRIILVMCSILCIPNGPHSSATWITAFALFVPFWTANIASPTVSKPLYDTWSPQKRPWEGSPRKMRRRASPRGGRRWIHTYWSIYRWLGRGSGTTKRSGGSYTYKWGNYINLYGARESGVVSRDHATFLKLKFRLNSIDRERTRSLQWIVRPVAASKAASSVSPPTLSQ